STLLEERRARATAECKYLHCLRLLKAEREMRCAAEGQGFSSSSELRNGQPVSWQALNFQKMNCAPRTVWLLRTVSVQLQTFWRRASGLITRLPRAIMRRLNSF